MDEGRLTDKDIAADLLSDLKEMALGYHMATIEAANASVRSTFMNGHDDCMKEQRELWETMYSKGWYPVQNATQTQGQASTSRAKPPGMM
ncbi:MAG: spore coat protein [Clostridia bacterium]|nr:spore coat protein [Clostridia bacterium]